MIFQFLSELHNRIILHGIINMSYDLLLTAHFLQRCVETFFRYPTTTI